MARLFLCAYLPLIFLYRSAAVLIVATIAIRFNVAHGVRKYVEA